MLESHQLADKLLLLGRLVEQEVLQIYLKAQQAKAKCRALNTREAEYLLCALSQVFP